MAKNRIGLVLSGGGAQGAYQAGAIKALFEAKFSFKIISGVSIGALNGLLTARGMIHEMEHTWMTLSRMQLIGISTIPNLLLSRGISLLGDQLQRDLIEKFIDLTHLRKEATELITAAVSLQTGKIHYFSTKKVKDDNLLRQMLLASCAIPGIFPPILINKEQFIDGGLLNNTPISPLLNKNLSQIIVISMEPPTYGKELLANVAEIALRSTSIFFKAQVERAQNEWELAKKQSELYFALSQKLSRFVLQKNKFAREIVPILKKFFPYYNKEIPPIFFIRPKDNLIIQQYDFDSKKIPYVFELGYLDAWDFIKKHKKIFGLPRA